jgi:hypothetical protein
MTLNKHQIVSAASGLRIIWFRTMWEVNQNVHLVCGPQILITDFDVSCGLNLFYNISKYANGRMPIVKLFMIMAMKGVWSIIGAFDVIIRICGLQSGEMTRSTCIKSMGFKTFIIPSVLIEMSFYCVCLVLYAILNKCSSIYTY